MPSKCVKQITRAFRTLVGRRRGLEACLHHIADRLVGFAAKCEVPCVEIHEVRRQHPHDLLRCFRALASRDQRRQPLRPEFLLELPQDRRL